jgi:hypothetical protein
MVAPRREGFFGFEAGDGEHAPVLRPEHVHRDESWSVIDEADHPGDGLLELVMCFWPDTKCEERQDRVCLLSATDIDDRGAQAVGWSFSPC